jgi:hypothetical protein
MIHRAGIPTPIAAAGMVLAVLGNGLVLRTVPSAR